MRTRALALALALSAGCTLKLNYTQCQTDQDCLNMNTATPYCTTDHICVTDTPVNRLCSGMPYPMQSSKTRTSRIGAILQTDGTTGPDTDRLTLIKYAVNEINTNVAAFSTSVGQIELYTCNVNSANDAVNALQLLANQYHIVAAIGPSSTDGVTALVNAASAVQVPIITPAATDQSLAGVSTQGYVFFMAPLDPAQAPTMAAAVNNQSTVVVLTEQSSYGQAVEQAFVTSYDSRDTMNNTGVQVRTPFNATDMGIASLANEAAMDAPLVPIISYMVLVVSPSTVAAVQDLAPMPYVAGNASKTTELVLSSGGRSGPMLALAAQVQQAAAAAGASMTATAALNNLYRVRGVSPAPLVPDTASTTFSSQFATANPGFNLQDDLYATFAYDALYTAALAIDSVQVAAGTTVSGADVAVVLRQISNTSSVVAELGYAAYPTSVAKLTKGGAVELEGLTGTIGFNTDGTRQGASFDNWWIDFGTAATPKTPVFVTSDPRAMSGGM